jgi:ribonuclease HI
LTQSTPEVVIFTDGACIGNPGPGGYGVVLLSGQHRKELSGGYRLTTNNRMEIIAAIRGLEALKTNCLVTLYSDSQYMVNAMTQGWAKKWQQQNWMRNRKDIVKNPDLWEQMLSLNNMHRIDFIWVRGHSGNKENERCDRLAVQAASGNLLDIDVGYVNSSSLKLKNRP